MLIYALTSRLIFVTIGAALQLHLQMHASRKGKKSIHFQLCIAHTGASQAFVLMRREVNSNASEKNAPRHEVYCLSFVAMQCPVPFK